MPIIFSRTPYNFNSWGDGKQKTRTAKRALEAVKRGYAYVVQNERGRYFSEGEWDILGVPLTDGYDAFTWMKNQSWSNGKIGTVGCSSTAEWQMAVAALDHPSHSAMVPQGYGAGVGRIGKINEQGNWFRGGAEQMLFFSWLYGVEHDKYKPRIPAGASQQDLIRISRFYDLAPENPPVDMAEALNHLPIQDILKNINGKNEIFDKMIRRKPNDEAWFNGGIYHDNMEIGVPSFWFASWYDVSITPNLALFNTRKVARNNQLAMIIWCTNFTLSVNRATENTIVGESRVGDARLNYEEQIYAWFDLMAERTYKTISKRKHHECNIIQWVAIKWQASDTWPPENAKLTTYYLNSNGKANSLFGDGKSIHIKSEF